jgi:hypothetical protein
MDAPKKHPKTKFTPEEDFLLKRFVAQFGSANWGFACRFVPNRTPRQCRERWVKYLSPENSFSPFTPEEDTLLRQLYSEHGAKWMKISRFFQNRTDISLKNRWLVLMRHDRQTPQSGGIHLACERSVDPTLLDPLELSSVVNWRFPVLGEEDWADL